MTCANATSTVFAKTSPSAAQDAACPACSAAATRQHSGRYRMQCLQCCTRLVLSAYPSKAQASAMLAAIDRFPLSPGREQVLESVRQCLEKRRSVGQKSTPP